MAQRDIRFGVIGCGLMGREFASAAARWLHLLDLDFRPVIVAACDTNLAATEWFTRNIPSMRLATVDYRDLLADPDIDAIYCAVPHNLHQQIYVDIIQTGKALLGEKPFGIDKAANDAINAAIAANPNVLVRSSSEFPYMPGALQIIRWVEGGYFGQIMEVEAGFWHSSDLNPQKPINWKRVIAANGEYGCMGDLGLHVLHLPLRFGWKPANVRALLSNIVTQRPDKDGNLVPCETWDNATLATEVEAADGQRFPMTLSTKRIAPGHSNTWFIRIYSTTFCAEFSTKNPKEVRYLSYQPGGDQAWASFDMPYQSAYPAITGGIFEFGLSDAILQMWAAFCEEFAHPGTMRGPLQTATPQIAAQHHAVLTAALESHKQNAVVKVNY